MDVLECLGPGVIMEFLLESLVSATLRSVHLYDREYIAFRVRARRGFGG